MNKKDETSIKERISKMEDKILQFEEEEYRLSRLHHLAKISSEPYHPTVADQEFWEEKGRPGAMIAWEKQGGGFTWKEDENGYSYIEKEIALKENEEYEQFCNEFFWEMTKEDWVNMYDRLLKAKRSAIKRWRLDLKKLRKDQRDQQRKVGDKIDQWIDKNIPNSNHKGTYKRVFEIISQHPNPNMNDYSAADFLKYVHKQYTPNLSDEMLRRRIPNFVRDLPL